MRAAALWQAWFLSHPREVGESYAEHAAAALGFAALLARAASACFAHALVPALFPTTASGLVATLHGRLTARRKQLAERGAEVEWAI